eukprot:9796239-Alexandrium_andersonii.AAC.1
MTEAEAPTEEYYESLRADMAERHPKACPRVLDHLLSLEAFLDVSILSGFSFGWTRRMCCSRKASCSGVAWGKRVSRATMSEPRPSRTSRL